MQKFISGKILAGLVVVAGILLAINNAYAGGGADLFFRDAVVEGHCAAILPDNAPVVGAAIHSAVGTLFENATLGQKTEILGPGAYHNEPLDGYGIYPRGSAMDSSGSVAYVDQRPDQFGPGPFLLKIYAIQPATGTYTVNNIGSLDNFMTAPCTEIFDAAVIGNNNAPGFILYTVSGNPAARNSTSTPFVVELTRMVLDLTGTIVDSDTFTYLSGSPGTTPGRISDYETYGPPLNVTMQVSKVGQHEVVILNNGPWVRIPANVTYGPSQNIFTEEVGITGMPAVVFNSITGQVTQSALIMGGVEGGESAATPTASGCDMTELTTANNTGMQWQFTSMTSDGQDSIFLTYVPLTITEPVVQPNNTVQQRRSVFTTKIDLTQNGRFFLDNYQYKPSVFNPLCNNSAYYNQSITYLDPAVTAPWDTMSVLPAQGTSYNWRPDMSQFTSVMPGCEYDLTSDYMYHITAAAGVPGLDKVSAVYVNTDDTLSECHRLATYSPTSVGGPPPPFTEHAAFGNTFRRSDITFNGVTPPVPTHIGTLPDFTTDLFFSLSIFDYGITYNIGTHGAYGPAHGMSDFGHQVSRRNNLWDSHSSIYGTPLFVKMTPADLRYDDYHPINWTLPTGLSQCILDIY